MYLMDSSDAFSVKASRMCPMFLVSVTAPSRGGRAGGPTATGSDKDSPEVSLPLICMGQSVPGPRLPEQPQDSMGRPRGLWVALARI